MLGDYMREKYLYKNLGVKERERVFAQREHIFGNLLYYGMSHTDQKRKKAVISPFKPGNKATHSRTIGLELTWH